MNTTNLTFGEAIASLKLGYNVHRSGWNGKGMFIWLNPGSCDMPLSELAVGHIEGIPANLFRAGDSGTVCRLPNLNMRSANGSTATGWVASQSDMLAEDWCINGPM